MALSMHSIVNYLGLPRHVSTFEESYLKKMNRIGLAFFALHVPALMLVAFGNGTKTWLAAVLSLAVFFGPAVAHATFRNPRSVSVVYGVAAMFFGALLVHFGQGPLQIEMHFYFFALIAMLAVFANPLVIIAAAVTVALHHLALWAIVPRSVFNYEAPVWVVAVHALFVVVESVAACYIARSFFDNVIGLEKIVEARTDALHARTRDLRLVLDNVRQGFVTLDRDGTLSLERSRAFREWFGSGTSIAETFASRSPAFASSLTMAWSALADDMLPIELLVEQLPRNLDAQGSSFRLSYDPIGDAATAERWLVVVTDVTAESEHERREVERHEVFHLVERAILDRSGVRAYLSEAADLVAQMKLEPFDLPTLKRHVHTLKGNSAIFEVESIASLCHTLESQIAEEGPVGIRPLLERIEKRSAQIADSVQRLIGSDHALIEIDRREHKALEASARLLSASLAERIHRLKLEPARRRLEHFAVQAMRIGARLEKRVAVVIDDGDVRLDPEAWSPFWSVFGHAVRNAVDHGLEAPAERERCGKPAVGTITFRTRVEESRLVVEVSDDGRGVAWERVRAKAKLAGLPCETDAELQLVLFCDGVSTAGEVTDISGRGVGMGALLVAARTLGGDVSVTSSAGVGTTVRIAFSREVLARATSSEKMRIATRDAARSILDEAV